MSVSAFEEITTKKARKSLLVSLKKSGGTQCARSDHGPSHRRRRKRKYRIIDFKRDKDGVPAKVATIEYDLNRSANIALLHYKDGEKEIHHRPCGP